MPHRWRAQPKFERKLEKKKPSGSAGGGCGDNSKKKRTVGKGGRKVGRVGKVSSMTSSMTSSGRDGGGGGRPRSASGDGGAAGNFSGGGVGDDGNSEGEGDERKRPSATVGAAVATKRRESTNSTGSSSSSSSVDFAVPSPSSGGRKVPPLPDAGTCGGDVVRSSGSRKVPDAGRKLPPSVPDADDPDSDGSSDEIEIVSVVARKQERQKMKSPSEPSEPSSDSTEGDGQDRPKTQSHKLKGDDDDNVKVDESTEGYHGTGTGCGTGSGDGGDNGTGSDGGNSIISAAGAAGSKATKKKKVARKSVGGIDKSSSSEFKSKSETKSKSKSRSMLHEAAEEGKKEEENEVEENKEEENGKSAQGEGGGGGAKKPASTSAAASALASASPSAAAAAAAAAAPQPRPHRRRRGGTPSTAGTATATASTTGTTTTTTAAATATAAAASFSSDENDAGKDSSARDKNGAAGPIITRTSPASRRVKKSRKSLSYRESFSSSSSSSEEEEEEGGQGGGSKSNKSEKNGIAKKKQEPETIDMLNDSSSSSEDEDGDSRDGGGGGGQKKPADSTASSASAAAAAADPTDATADATSDGTAYAAAYATAVATAIATAPPCVEAAEGATDSMDKDDRDATALDADGTNSDMKRGRISNDEYGKANNEDDTTKDRDDEVAKGQDDEPAKTDGATAAERHQDETQSSSQSVTAYNGDAPPQDDDADVVIEIDDDDDDDEEEKKDDRHEENAASPKLQRTVAPACGTAAAAALLDSNGVASATAASPPRATMSSIAKTLKFVGTSSSHVPPSSSSAASSLHQTLLTAHLSTAAKTAAVSKAAPAKLPPSTNSRQQQNSDEDPVEIDENGNKPINPKAVVCWACAIPLQKRSNSPSSSDEDNGWGDKRTGLYSIHAHPLLQISVCSVCADKAYIVEDEAQDLLADREHVKEDGTSDGEAETAEMEACSLCAIEATGEEDGPILLCCDECPRTFCTRCVAILNGGGNDGREYVDSITKVDNGEEWQCPECVRPAAMDEMQEAFVNWTEEGGTVEADKPDEGGESDEPISPESKSTAALIDELNLAEDGLNEAARMLEFDNIAKEREEIIAEIRQNQPDIIEAALEKEVDAEMDGLIEQWSNHHSRLCETATTLQDALEERRIDLVALYKDREVNILGKNEAADNNDAPSYVKEAEAALNKRDQEEGFASGEFRGSSGYKMDSNVANLDVEDLDQSDIKEIEDINTLESTLAQLEHISKRDNRKCRWSKTELTEGDIENMRRRALRRDDEELQRLDIDIETLERRGHKEEDDAKKEHKQRRKETSRRKSGGARINLLALSTVRRKVKSTTQSAKKAQRRRSDAGDGARYGVAFSGVKRNRPEVSIQPVGLRERSFSAGMSHRDKGPAGTKAAKRRIVPEPVSGGYGASRDLFSSSSAFASLAAFDRYGDEQPTPKTPTFPYEESDLVLASSESGERLVSVVKPLANILKPHQVEGVKFMWETTCSDLLSNNEVNGESNQVKGAILAHNMGLGKSVQLCAFLHTFLAHPAVINSKKAPPSSKVTSANAWHGSVDQSSPSSLLKSLQATKIRRALLCVPVNTIANWENEWAKWILTKEKDKEITPVSMYNLNSYPQQSRIDVILQWMKEGGVLLTSDRILSGLCKSLLPPSEKQAAKGDKSSGDTDRSTSTSRSNSPTERYKDVLNAALLNPGPDVVCLDEGHTFLKNSGTNISKTLHAMAGVTRRIVLTGTPIQNNLTECYRMATWTNPSCGLGTEASFDRKFTAPVMKGMEKDCTAQELFLYQQRMHELQRILDPFVQRKGADVLANDLPPMQQVVLNLRMSKLQAKLYRAFAQYRKQPGVKNNFFDQYQKLRPINNHPATLLIPGRDSNKNGRASSPVPESLSSRATTPLPTAVSEGIGEENTPIASNQDTPAVPNEEKKSTSLGSIETDDVVLVDETRSSVEDKGSSKLSRTSSALSTNVEEEKWWQAVHDKNPDDFNDWLSGGKVVLMLQILCHADMIGDKVVIFTQCLKTMDFIETILNSPDWGKTIPAISTLSPGKQWGQWRKNREYLRIDGATSASDRGDLVTSFNQDKASTSATSELENQAKLFLISKEAGGVGINLYAANRVILFDSHWNPAIDLQAIYRCYRYGQTKPVYAYRFLTEGTMEEKIYSRSVNKSGLAARVIDQKNPERAFTSSELTDILAMDTWVCCDLCDKWRQIPPWAEVDENEFEGEWCCDMNTFDKPRSRCDAKERDRRWYADYFQKQLAKRLRKELARQQQQEQQLSHSQSQDVFRSQSQEPTLFESEMRESIDSTRPRDDPNKAANTQKDVILRRLLFTAGGSKADHEADPSKKKKKKKHVSSWISKFHFHDSLLKHSDKEAQNLKAAAAAGVADNSSTTTTTTAGVKPNTQASGAEGATVAAVAAAAKRPEVPSKDEEIVEAEETMITNSPPPTPDPNEQNKQGKGAASAKKEKNADAMVKSEPKKKSKRSRMELTEEAKVGDIRTPPKKSRRKKRTKESSLHVRTHHENGHDVLEILDSDEEDVDGEVEKGVDVCGGAEERVVDFVGDEEDEEEEEEEEGDGDGVLV